MNKKEKKRIISFVAAPVIASLLVCAVFLTVIKNVDSIPFKNNTVYFSDYQQGELVEAPSFEYDGGNIRRSDIGDIEPNTIMGEIGFLDVTFPVIYNANDINSAGRVNVAPDGKIFGEIGSVYAQINKADSTKLRLLNTDNTISVNTYYSGYEYQVVKTLNASTLNEVYKAGAGIPSALVIYTDASLGVGIGDEYFVCVAKLVSENMIEE